MTAEKKRAQAAARKAKERRVLADRGIKQLVIPAPVVLHAEIKEAVAAIIANHADPAAY